MKYEEYRRLFWSFEPCILGFVLATACLGFVFVLWPWFESGANRLHEEVHVSFGGKKKPRWPSAAGLVVKGFVFALLLVAAYVWWLPDVKRQEEHPGLATLMTAARHDKRWEEAMYDQMSLTRPRIGSQDFKDARWSYRLAHAPDRLSVPPRNRWVDRESRAEDIFSLAHPDYGHPIRVDRLSGQETRPREISPLESRARAWQRTFSRLELLIIPKKFWPAN